MSPGGNSRPPDTAWPEALTEPVRAFRGESRIFLAFSGGLDSTILLQVAASCLPPSAHLTAVHVNHQLQPNSMETEASCRRQCEALGVDFLCRRVVVDQPEQGVGGLEEAARQARYQVFEQVLADGGVLLMAHHRDDQAETVLFRFLRGSGVAGLAGMPARRRLGRGWLARPFLHVERAQLQAWAEAAGLRWTEDPSNTDQRFDRNFLRHGIVPRLKARWPSLLARLDATATACREAAELSQSLAQLRFAQVGSDQGTLVLAELSRLSLTEQKNLLRWWIARAGYRLPELKDWGLVLAELIQAAPDREPELRGDGFTVRRFRGHLYLVADQAEMPMSIDQLTAGQSVRWDRLRISLNQVDAGCTQIPRIQVCARGGGERFRPVPGGPSRSLKNWLQEQAVPPWQRARLPLFYERSELVGIGGLWLSPRFSGAAPESGWRIVVERDCD
ncbi:MAG: tRNA lysidine(34) synthetase TilS [Marinobacter sp.]|uniref:tRNA lysidine(34) synthetase TilS n=1 Tax=Marinobacter sp. TaxID=50741 RepID=UPI00299DFDD5|nr:tRNA lysidine(34) synthetase TilS [Marinobacter sp.]MDX1757662.1 tRNA lysidine(34) synthetase TilS [Marinobacter sp.]